MKKLYFEIVEMQNALEFSDVPILMEIANQASDKAISFHVANINSVNEEALKLKFQEGMKVYVKVRDDRPRTPCISFERLLREKLLQKTFLAEILSIKY